MILLALATIGACVVCPITTYPWNFAASVAMSMFVGCIALVVRDERLPSRAPNVLGNAGSPVWRRDVDRPACLRKQKGLLQ